MRLALVLVAGCASYGTMTTARTVAPGASQATAALELDGLGVVENHLRVPMPALAVGVRRGLSRNVDLGGKVSGLPGAGVLTAVGLEAQARWRVVGAPDTRWEIAIAPVGGWRGVASSGARWDAAHVALPVVVGLNVGARGRHQLFVAPKVGWQRWWSAGAMPVDLPFGGAGLGCAWRLRARLMVVPEATVLRSPTGASGSAGTAIVHVGIGLVWDGK